mmetsp:Transcript_14242/g.18173  ORF Transcript_14242/g.18173 Transcript_14242/m.18173 type:complete len:208 (+) Transcript_14242:320-943(+)
MSIFADSKDAKAPIKENGIIKTDLFLNVCKHVVRVVEKFGVGMSLVKRDINGNIATIEKCMEDKESIYNDIFRLVREEQQSHEIWHSGLSPCSIALLWLYRAMAFMVRILTNVLDAEPEEDGLVDAVVQAYRQTLEPFHGWIASTAFSVAIGFVPSRRTFLNALVGDSGVSDETLLKEMRAFVDRFAPILTEVNDFFEKSCIDDQVL